MVQRAWPQIVFLVGVWYVLVDGSPRALLSGVLAVIAGHAAWWLLSADRRPTGLRPSRLVGFLSYFGWQSVLGGWDVSRRALTPTLPLRPELLTHPLTLSSLESRIFFTNALSLLPGTIGADLHGDELVVHLLVGGAEATTRTRELERRVALLFGEPTS